MPNYLCVSHVSRNEELYSFLQVPGQDVACKDACSYYLVPLTHLEINMQLLCACGMQLCKQLLRLTSDLKFSIGYGGVLRRSNSCSTLPSSPPPLDFNRSGSCCAYTLQEEADIAGSSCWCASLRIGCALNEIGCAPIRKGDNSCERIMAQENSTRVNQLLSCSRFLRSGKSFQSLLHYLPAEIDRDRGYS